MEAPLADAVRPTSLDDIVGQQHLVGPGGILRRIVERGVIPNMIFYGPSGCGKTTVARIVAQLAGKRLHKLNGTSASTADIREVIAEVDSLAGYGGVVLYLDEIQYLNKKQQQSLLEHIENGNITLIASTTENPYFYVYNAILSRCTVFEFKPIEREEVERAVVRAASLLSEKKGKPIAFEEGVAAYIATACGGDVRKALGAVELGVVASDDGGERITLTLETAKALAQKSSMRYDRDADEHYDILSAYHKSLRGSDPDAALHYLARLLEVGDMASACRRLLCAAAEDVGLAYPQCVGIVKSCVDAALQLGLPEAQLPLAQAVILVATAPKSNSASSAIWEATADLKAGQMGEIPAHLKDAHYGGAKKMGRGLTYQYPHDFPGHYVAQQYLPDALKDKKYYTPQDNKFERANTDYWETVKNKKTTKDK